VSVVKSLREAVDSSHFRARRVFEGRISSGDGADIPAIPLPIARGFMLEIARQAPSLGEADCALLANRA
jgi:hypothetical protein